jgi:hypothetical protein
MTYSSLMVESKELLVKEERWLEATPAAIPPLTFLRTGLCNGTSLMVRRLKSDVGQDRCLFTKAYIF